MSLKRPAAGGESCKQDSFLLLFVVFGIFCFTEVLGCDRIKTLLQAGYEGIIWHGFCTVKADRGYLSDIFFRENEVEGLWGSI